MLKITHAEVYRNSRILLGEDCHIRYKPKSPYQVIIGQNGIGKSTLLTNLLSYPSLGGKGFHKDGFSSVIFDSNEKEVIVKITHDGKYSFLYDNEEKNVGGTQSVQKEMFAEYLNITADIESVLNPNFDFNRLSPQKRQEFLAKLTTGDLGFALQLHKKLEQRARQHDGVIKRLESNLIELRAKAIPETEYTAYKERLQLLNDDIRDLYIELKQQPMGVSTKSLGDFTSRISQLENNLTREWVKHYCFGGVDASDDSDASEKLYRLRLALVEKEKESEGLMQQYEMFNEVLTSLKIGDDEDLDTRLASLEQQLNSFPPEESMMVINLPSERDYRDAHKALSELYSTLAIKVSEVQGEWSESLLQADLEALREEHQLIERKVFKLDAEIAAIDAELTHQHTGEVRCPDCNKLFTPGLDEKRRNSSIKRREQLSESRQRGQAVLEEKIRYGQQVRACQDQYHCIRQMCNVPILTTTFEAINGLASLVKDSSHWLRVCSFALQNLEVMQTRAGVEEDISTLLKQKQMLSDSNIESTQSLADKLEFLNDRIWSVNNDSASLRKRIQSYSQSLEKVRRYDKWAQAQEEEYSEIGVDLMATIERELDVIQRELLQTLQASANEISTLISNYEKDHAQLEYLEQMIVTEREAMVATRLSADELSPKTGMIAEQLFGFIESFFDDVMEICNTIWTYNVQIYSGKDNAASLTYLFPVEFNYQENRSEDLAKTSEGQYSLINFAIKITALRYLGYTGGVLFLDEPEADFTPMHKVKMMNFIRDMVESGLFSQVFIISHHESGWGALPNPDIADFSHESNLPGTNEVIQFK